MKNYVISLTTAKERRAHIIKEFGKQGVDFEFFDAITPKEIEHHAKRLNLPLIGNQRLSLGEKACFLSHVCLWQKMLDDDVPYMAVFEDDIYLGEHATEFLNHEHWLNAIDFDLIKLETWHELVNLGAQQSTHHHRHLHTLKSIHVGTAGYIITQSGIKKLLGYIRQLSSDECFAIDHIMFGAFLSQGVVLQMTPALCQQPQNPNTHHTLISQLENDRKANTFVYKANDGLFTLIHKFFRRLYRSIGKRTFYQTVKFQ
ncbi:glycosyltransferase family 25 protein [Moraxella sp. VT-16-12]|uniref:glycosyltransferase family 25 protein n=1 Tax=Moraxella sp. VT-16-12 TaxID=2014877 RepID=UPI000B7F78E4|nr:glycosyltransferase family 25 protein [Moraxella sp. VT-16-12]TWV83510.1 glycosyltransferase family 25 protein [Moraxella sp. VT-16-12]